MWIWPPLPRPWGGAWSVIGGQTNPQQVYMSGGNLDFDTIGPYTLADNIIFHCEEATDVTIDLVAMTDLIAFMHDTSRPPPVSNTATVIATQGTILDSINVTQIPEPATILLLGAGGNLIAKMIGSDLET